MRILHILPSIRSGGVNSIVYSLASHQAKCGNKVDVFVGIPRFNHSYKKYNDAGVGVKYSKYNHTYDIRRIRELYHIMQAYDIIHVHLFPWQFYASIAHRMLNNNRPVLVTTEHNTYNNRRKYKLLRYFDRWMYQAFDRIISISDDTKHNLDEWLNDIELSNKDITITNGVDIDCYKTSVDTLSSELKLPQNSRVIVMVARLLPPKDPITLVKAISECPENVHVVFIGYGELEKEISEISETLGLHYRVHLLGIRNDIPSLIKGAHIGVLSTNWDGFGLVAVEYMAAGLPVLASDVDGLRNVVGRKDALFKPGDYHDLSRKINALLSSQQLYDEMKAYFKDRANIFSSDKMCKEYLNLYTSLLR